MHIGHKISGIGHIGLISWVLFGGLFSAGPEEVRVTQVSMISEAEFAALNRASEAPEALAEVPQPAVPVAEPTPDVSSQTDSPPQTPEPPVTEQVPPEPTPEPIPEPPVAEVEDQAPKMEPPVAEQVAALPPLPNPEPEPAAQPAPRVAPEPVAPPERDVKVDTERRRETTPDKPAEEVVKPEEETAPEAATTEIITEAKKDKPSAPERSKRPQARPERVAEVTEPKPTPKPEPKPANPNDSVNAALAEAMAAATPEPSRAAGPPLTRGEQNALIVAVQDCWVVDVGSRAANVTVTLGMTLDRSGQVVASSLKLLGGEGGDQKAIQTAFNAARRAVLRCQKGGYPLPVEKYEQWREIEMTFNPEHMRIK